MRFQDKKHFCLMPFLHVHIDSTGTAKACCISNINLGKIKNSSIQEIFQGEEIDQLRSSFLENKKDDRCINCYKKEASGSSSLRLETLEKYEKLIPDLLAEPKLIYFDIRFSNICNLKCRTCWHGNSSKWFDDAKKLNRAIGDKSLIQAFKSEEELKQNLEPFLETAVEFYFAGGEPLLMEEHLFVLRQLHKKKNFDCLLRYNTNLSILHQFDKNLVEIWQDFKQVEILASIEGLGEKGELIRSGINSKEFIENFRQIKELKNVQIKIAPTLSLLNADLLPELHQYFFKENLIGINDVHFNILHQPYFYNVKALPKDQKDKIQKLFKNHIKWIESHKGNTSDWENAINYMNSEDLSKKYEKTKHETKLLNELREENLTL
jgi:sulfatase maturation enzyme AslB (radical SAM superfamily)